MVDWLPGLLWASPFVGVAPMARRKPHVADAAPAQGIPVSVVIPARDESATIATVVRSILATSYAPLELIVVDDRSTDDTANQVASMAASDSRLRLIPGDELPTGWLGKPWACHQGAMVATGRYIVFTDADTDHAPALLGHVIGAMERDAPALLTLSTRQSCVTFWERVVMPQIMLVLAIRYTPSRINRATRAGQLVANGQFILVRREAYQAIGGHAAVRGEIVEDLALAQHFFRSGHRVQMLHAESLISTRMYRSRAELVEGWTKNLYLGARQSMGGHRLLRALAPWALVLAFVTWLVPFIALALGFAKGAALVAIGCSLLFWSVMLRGMQIPLWHALGYPIGAAMALAITLRSIWRGTRRVEWRGRNYHVAEPQ